LMMMHKISGKIRKRNLLLVDQLFLEERHQKGIHGNRMFYQNRRLGISKNLDRRFSETFQNRVLLTNDIQCERSNIPCS
jgi:hypothetical protein